MDAPSPAISFGRLLRQYRRAAGLTQETLAEQAGYSAIYLRKLERGERRPLLVTVNVLADALQLDAAEREALQLAARRAAEPVAPARPPAPSQPPSEDEPLPPLVGRAHERARLEQHLFRQSLPLLLLAGEPGIG